MYFSCYFAEVSRLRIDYKGIIFGKELPLGSGVDMLLVGFGVGRLDTFRDLLSFPRE